VTARRITLGLVALVLTLGVISLSARAATGGAPSLSDVRVDGGQVRGVLTVPGATQAHGIDAGSVKVAFGSAPAQPAHLTPITLEHRSALIMIDTSGSMAGAGLTAAKSAAEIFLDQVPADIAVGLASFAHAPHLLVSPRTDRQSVRRALARVTAGGDTSLYDAIMLGGRVLGAAGSRTLVLLSDGADTVSRATLRTATAEIRQAGIRPVVVGFRTGDMQNGVLRAVAGAGAGVFTQAHDTASLRRAFGSAAEDISTQVRLSAAVPAGLRGAQHITITGTVQGRPFDLVADVVIPGTSAATSGKAAAQPAITRAPVAGSGRVPWIAAAAVFLGLLAIALVTLAGQLVPAAKARIRSLDAYLAVGDSKGGESSRQALGGGGLSGWLTKAADGYIARRPAAERTGMLLERSDLPLRLNEWYVLRVLAFPACAALLWLPTDPSGSGKLVVLIAAIVVAGAVPPLVLRHVARRRARRFEAQLPDVLTLIATSLSSGFSLGQALDGISRDAAEPAAKEFSRALAETRIGIELEDALERTAVRMDSTNLHWTTMAVRIQRRVGGDLAEVMRTTAGTIRDRESLRRQVRALSAEGRISANILVAIPIVMASYLYLTSRAYLATLWGRPVGVVVLIISVVMLIAGMFWMRRITDVKV
jgi:tight adherence protein B